MPKFDESAIRKAAAWQDFKEAQSLLNIGSVIESRELPNGWNGSVKVGKRIFRATVDMKTPTWFDATCPCPGNRREGKFCSHAIAVGLHLVAPPVSPAAEEKTTSPPARSHTAPAPALSIPDLAWKIRFQGPWERTIMEGRASVSLGPSERPSTSADRRLTAWLISQKATSKAHIQLALSPDTLPGFLGCLENHPETDSATGKIGIDSGTQLHIRECSLIGDQIHIVPESDTRCAMIGNSIFQLTDNGISRTGSIPLDPKLLPFFQKLAAGKPVDLPSEVFLGHLDALQSFIDFSSSEWFESLQFVPVDPDVELSLTGSPRKIVATLHTSYSQSLPELRDGKVFTKNAAGKTKTLATFYRAFSPLSVNSQNPFEITDPSAIRTLLTKTLKSLPSHWEIQQSPAIERHAKSFVFITPKFEIHHSDDRSVSFSVSYETEDSVRISAEEVRRLLRSKGSHGIHDKGKEIVISEDIENLIDPLFQDLEVEQANGRYMAKGASSLIVKEIGQSLSRPSNPGQPLRKAENFAGEKLPEIRAELRPYQRGGYSWLVNRLDRYQGALLADDMGLGKTIQTIACIERILSDESENRTALVVMTTSLLGNWLSEISRFIPHRKTITLHGSGRDKLREKIRPGNIVLTTYTTLARDLAYHLRQDYALVVIDEASLIRNPDTDHSKAVAKLNAERRIALTGTPVENSARDLWSIFRFIQPGWLGTRKAFEEKYEQPLKSPETAENASRLLRLKTSPFVLRRTKSEVAPELPSKIQIDEFCDLSKDQLATYREIQKQGIQKITEIRDSGQKAAARMQTLSLLLRLRQTCCDLSLLGVEKLANLPVPRRSSKLERLLEITEQSIAAESKILVFSQFQKQLVAIEEQLAANGTRSLRLDGKTRNRQALVDEFQSDEGPPVFLISLKAGGYGLNLTAADVVVHFDPWWNPAAEAQATDRAHRIGQTKPVTVFRLLTRNTVEEKVTGMQKNKKALADSLDETVTPTDAPGWTTEEIERLLTS
eukprot:g3939.t1